MSPRRNNWLAQLIRGLISQPRMTLILFGFTGGMILGALYLITSTSYVVRGGWGEGNFFEIQPAPPLPGKLPAPEDVESRLAESSP